MSKKSRRNVDVTFLLELHDLGVLLLDCLFELPKLDLQSLLLFIHGISCEELY